MPALIWRSKNGEVGTTTSKPLWPVKSRVSNVSLVS